MATIIDAWASGHRYARATGRRRWILAGTLIGLVFGGALLPGPIAAQDADTPVAFDIPPQALGASLNNVAVQASLQIIFEQAPVEGLQAPAISGSMTAKQALQTLLSGTALQFTQNADGILVVSPKPKTASVRPHRKPAAAAAVPTPPVPSVVAAPAAQPAQEREGPWLLRVRASYLDAHNRSDAFDIPGALPTAVPADGVRTGDRWAPEVDAEYFFTPHWSAELALTLPRVHDLDVRNAPGNNAGSVGSFRLMPDLLTLKYNFLTEGPWRPYIGLGINVTSYYGEKTAPFSLRSSTAVGPAAQAGIDVRLSHHWFFNADFKWARARPTIEYNGASIGIMKLDPMLFGIGIGYRFGAKVAPATSSPAPAPPQPTAAPLDSDGDGVPDTHDQCPNTPPGAKVDSVGCPLDSDHDGVPDYLDRCPGTPAGLKVDANGCEIEEMVLTGVAFETNSATLTPASFEVLDRVVTVLRQRPSDPAAIHGYTDSRGSEEYNQKLSERRASAVVNYLTTHGVSDARLSSEGFGKRNPVASNESPAGRAQNRRVTVEFSKPVPR